MRVAIRIVIGSAALIAALTSALASSALAASSAPSAALMAPIETAFDALNTTNEAMWNSAYTIHAPAERKTIHRDRDLDDDVDADRHNMEDPWLGLGHDVVEVTL